MKYIIETLDWDRPMYFCAHEGKGFTVSSDPMKAEVFTTREQAKSACEEFAKASGMKCAIKRL